MGRAVCPGGVRTDGIMYVNNPLPVMTVKENTYFNVLSIAHRIKLTLNCYPIYTDTHIEIV